MRLLLLVALAFFTAGTASAQQFTPPPVQTRTEVTLTAPPPDPKVIAETSVKSSEAIIVGAVAPPLIDWDNRLLDLPDLWRTTPPDLTYNNPHVRDLANLLQLGAFALLALAVFANGATHALQGSTSWGRLIFAAVLVAGNLTWWQWGIALNNTICAGIRAPSMNEVAMPFLQMPANPGEAFADVVLVVIFGLVLLLTLFSLAMRLGLIDVLIASGSLFLVLYATEQTQSWARGYVRVSIGTLYSQVIIVIGLVTAQVLGSISSGVGGALLAIVVLLLVRSLPHTMAGIGGSGSAFGRVVSLAILRKLL